MDIEREGWDKEKSEMNATITQLKLDMNQSRQDMEKGLLVLTELSHEVQTKVHGIDSDESGLKQVQQELADQQDAMDALMDMLEKTITVEVTPCTLICRFVCCSAEDVVCAGHT